MTDPRRRPDPIAEEALLELVRALARDQARRDHEAEEANRADLPRLSTIAKADAAP